MPLTRTTFGALGHSIDACFDSTRFPVQGSTRKRQVVPSFERREGEFAAPTLAFTSMRAQAQEAMFCPFVKHPSSVPKVGDNPIPLYDRDILHEPAQRNGIGITLGKYALSLGQADLRVHPKQWLKHQHQRARPGTSCSSLSHVSTLPALHPCSNPTHGTSLSRRKNQPSSDFPLRGGWWSASGYGPKHDNRSSKPVLDMASSPHNGSAGRADEVSSIKEFDDIDLPEKSVNPENNRKDAKRAGQRFQTVPPLTPVEVNAPRWDASASERPTLMEKCAYAYHRAPTPYARSEVDARSTGVGSSSLYSRVTRPDTSVTQTTRLTKEVKKSIKDVFQRVTMQLEGDSLHHACLAAGRPIHTPV